MQGSAWLRTLARVVVRALALLLGVAVIAALTLVFYAQTEPGRRVLARELSQRVSSEIRGSMHIGHLERASLSPIVRDLEFRDEHGRRALFIERAEVKLDAAAALDQQLVFERARVWGAQLLVAVRPDGRTNLEATFSEPKPDPSPAAREGLHYSLRSIHFDSLDATFEVSRDQTFHVHDMRGFVRIERIGTPGVRVRLDQVSGTTERELLGDPLTLERVDGWIAGGTPQVLELELDGRLGETDVQAELRYFAHAKTPVRLALRTEKSAKGVAAGLMLELSSWLSEDVEVDLL